MAKFIKGRTSWQRRGYHAASPSMIRNSLPAPDAAEASDTEERVSRMPTTSHTAHLMKSLELILFEIGKMSRLLDEPRCEHLPHTEVRQFKVALHALRERAQRMFDWLGEQRLESPKN